VTVLRLENVTKNFGPVRAVDDVSLTVADGSLVALVGPSGCGKTTLLHLIAGLDECDQGQILFDDRRVDHLRAADRDVAMVFQDYALYPQLDVAENLTVGLRLRGVRRPERRRRAAEIARRLSLTDVLERRPAQLSGGQRQRVAVGRAVLRDPRLLLLDEPLSNLDAGLRNEVRSEIREVQRALGVTAVYVTHDQAEALAIADSIVVMLDGRVVQVGTPEELYTAPRTVDVARMIGDAPMNFRLGIADRRDDGTTQVEVDGIHRTWPQALTRSPASPMGSDAAPNDRREVIVAVRSCDLALAEPSVDDGQVWSWVGSVTSVEFQGSRTLVVIDVDGQRAARDDTPSDRRQHGPFQVLAAGSTRVRVGDRCRAIAPREALHVFDAASGERLCPDPAGLTAPT
jgi:ABC-type sugar transport system ATPase subunit